MTAPALPQSILQDRRLYEVLCIKNFSTTEEVRVAYKALALKNHPDKNIGDPSAADRFREISRAYEVLGNPEHKKRYDVALRSALAQCGGSCGAGSLGSNPYSVNPVSMSDIYKDLYKRQSERAATRARTTSQPPKDPQRTTSQYTKAQQELFRKREKERQQELRKQIEKEKKDQRERERAALRKEQERQEELLQQRWQQQRGFAPRMATRIAGNKRASSTGTGGGVTGSARYAATNSGSARGAEGGSSRNVTPRTTNNTTTSDLDGGLSDRRTRASAPNTVRVGTPARNGTPRVRRTGAAAFSPGSRSNDLFGFGTPTTPTPTSTTKDDEDGDEFIRGGGGEEKECGANDTHQCNGGGSGGWYTPLMSSMNGESSVHILLNSTVSSGNDDVCSSSSEDHLNDEEDATSSSNPPPNTSMGFTDTKHNMTSTFTTTACSAATAEGPSPSTVLHRSQDQNPVTAASTHTSSRHTSNNNSNSGMSRSDLAHICKASLSGHTVQRCVPNATTTPLSGVAARTYSPRSTTATTSTTTPRRGLTPRGQTTGGLNARATSPSASTPRTAAGITMGSGRTTTATFPGAAAARTTSPLPGSKAAAGAPSPFLHRVRATRGLTESDKELLEKQRRERMAKEEERQRAVRLAEEERQFKGAARALKQQKAASGAAAAAEVKLTMEDLLTYVQTDETSERQQFIEREEQLAWRRLQRHHIIVLAETIFRKKFAALSMEELVRRNMISSAARHGVMQLGCAFQEWAQRCSVEWREGRDRRQLKGREAAHSYHAQRLAQRKSALLTEETAQRGFFTRRALYTLTVLCFSEAEAQDRMSVEIAEGRARRAFHTSFLAESNIQKTREAEAQANTFTSGGTDPLQLLRVDGREAEEDGSHDLHLSRVASPLAAPMSGGAAQKNSYADSNHSNSSTTVNNGVFHASVVSVGPPTAMSINSAPVAEEHTSTGVFQSTHSENSAISTTTSFSAAATTPAGSPLTVINTARSGNSSNDNVSGELRPSNSAAGERRVQALVSDEARQRRLLLSQQHHEEVALRKRRATALHRTFAAEKEDAVKAARRSAQAEVRALQAELRLMQRQQHERNGGGGGTNTSASASSTLPQNGSCSSSLSSPRATRPSLTSSVDTTPMKPVVVTTVPTLSYGNNSSRIRNGVAAAACTSSFPAPVVTAAAKEKAATTAQPPLSRRHVASSPGWKTLLDSDVEDGQ